MAFQSLWKRQCESGKEHSVWLDNWVINVCFLIFELLIKEICCSDRDETVPLRQTVTDCGIDHPKVIFTGLTAGSPTSLKLTVLIKISRLQQGTQPRGVEESHPERDPMCLYLLKSE